MQGGVLLLLLLLLLMGLRKALELPGMRGKRFQPLPYPGIRNKTFIRQYLDAHNLIRAGVSPPASNMLYMTWDLALARTANAWAKRCLFQHNPFSNQNGASHPDPCFNPPGENLWIGNAFRRPFDPTPSVRAWYSEVDHYNYQNNTCARTCGQYTQIVWDSTYKLGCAVVFCRKLGAHRNVENFVCYYGPMGNGPRKPYKIGLPCSACPEGDTCENNLCRNPKRDQDNSKRYAQWFPPWERLICDQYCIAVSVIRPSLMFLGTFAVYCLQRYFYPGLNCKDDLYNIM